MHERARWDLWGDRLRFRLGAAVQVDGTVIAANDEFRMNYGSEDSVALRRARLSATGTLYGLLFSFQYDFGQDDGVKDAYLEVLGTV